jgi:hypothetical protein
MKKKITVLAICASSLRFARPPNRNIPQLNAVPGGQGDQMTGYTPLCVPILGRIAFFP